MSDGRFLSPHELSPLPPDQQAAGNVLMGAAQTAVDEIAQIHFPGADGHTLFFAGEQVAVTPHRDRPETNTAAIVRPDWAEDRFVMRDARGNESPLHINAEGLTGPGMRDYNRTVQAIRLGRVIGSQEISAVRWLENFDRPDPAPVTCNVSVRYTSDGWGRNSLAATANLSLTRTYDDLDLITQTHTVHYDPATGLYSAGSTLISKKFAEDESTFDPASGTVGGEMVPDPFPEMTADTQQDRFLPSPPVNRALTVMEWMGLIQNPLGSAVRLAPRA